MHGVINNMEYRANAYKKSVIVNCSVYLKPVEITALLIAIEGHIKVDLKIPFLSFYTVIFWPPVT